MLKAVVIDDEYIVIEGLKKVIDWNSFGIELVGTASDGISGLKVIEEKHPDIILTDIRMPSMNGLALIENAKVFVPNAVFIIFSGYNEFEYARSAISLGVIDYLDKPVTVEKIESTLIKAIEVARKREEESNLIKNIMDSQKIMLEKLFYRLISGEEVQHKELLNILKPYNIDLISIREILVAVAQQEDCIENTGEYNEKIIKIFKENCSNDLMESFIIRNGKEIVFIFFNLSSHKNIFDMLEAIKECKKLFEKENVNFYMGVGGSYQQILNIYNSYLEAKKALKYAFFKDNTSIVNITDVEYSNHIPYLLNEGHDSIIFNIRSGNKLEVLAQVNKFLEVLRGYNLSPEIFSHECLELIYLALKVSMETGKNYVAEKELNFAPHIEILKFKTFFDISKWLISFFEGLMDWIANIQNNSNRRSIIKVREYLDQNYFKEITLNEMADMVNINATYLSMLFKEQVGTTYIKYLTNVRIEKSKKLLSEGYKVKEVSEMVGYHNYRHFTELFKKFIGMTPEQFKGKTK